MGNPMLDALGSCLASMTGQAPPSRQANQAFRLPRSTSEEQTAQAGHVPATHPDITPALSQDTVTTMCEPHALLEAVRALRVAYPDLGVKRLLAKLREQQPDLGAGTREVREALTALKADPEKAESEAPGSPSSTMAPLSEL